MIETMIRAVLLATFLSAAAGRAEAGLIFYLHDTTLRGTGEQISFRNPVPFDPRNRELVLVPLPTTPINGAIISSNGAPFIVAGGEHPFRGFTSIGVPLVFDFAGAGEYATAFAVTGITSVTAFGVTVYDTSGVRIGGASSRPHPNPSIYDQSLSVVADGDTRIGRVELSNAGGASPSERSNGIQYYRANGLFSEVKWQGSMVSGPTAVVPEPSTWAGAVTGLSLLAVPALWRRRKRASPQARAR